MKKIINDLMYDTDNSKLIHNDELNKRRWYKTHNGNYFVVYRTGEIIPKTEENVKEYLGKVDVKAYIKLFGKPKEA